MSATAATRTVHTISINRCREPQSHVYLQGTERFVDSGKLHFTLGMDTEGLSRIALWGQHVLLVVVFSAQSLSQSLKTTQTSLFACRAAEGSRNCQRQDKKANI